MSRILQVTSSGSVTWLIHEYQLTNIKENDDAQILHPGGFTCF